MSTLTVTAANRGSGRLKRESQFRHRKRFPLTTRFRREKVRVIQKQLAEGIYDLDEHLNAGIDRLYEVLTGPKIDSTGHSPI